MTEELESAQEQTEEAQSPAVPSAVSEDKPTSAPGVNVEEIVDALMPKLEEQIDRRFQSGKDRRIAGLLDDVETLKSYVKGAGGDIDRAVREMQIDTMLEQRGSGAAVQGGTEASGTEAAFEAISTELLSGAGIAFDDAEYEAFARQWSGKIRNPSHWRDVLDAHIARRQSKAAKQGEVTEAAVASTSGASLGESAETDIAAITAKLKNYYAGRHGAIGNPKVQQEIRELEAKLEEVEPLVNLDDPNIRVDLSATEPWSS